MQKIPSGIWGSAPIVVGSICGKFGGMIRSRVTLAVLSLITVSISAAAFGQELRLSSIQVREEGVVELTLADSPPEGARVEASTNFTNWTEVNASAQGNGVISVTGAVPEAAAVFFRVFTTSQSDSFVATVNADYAGPIRGATITVVGSEKQFTTDANGRASIPISDLTFESGFRLEVEAARFVTEIIDLPPALYAYTFSLTPVPLAPETVIARTYKLGASNSITLYASGLARVESTNDVSLGAYHVERSTTIADTWSIKAATPSGYESVSLTFTSESAGRYTNIINGKTVSGDFAQSAFVAEPNIQPVAPAATLKTARFVTLNSPIGPGLDFTVTFTGASTGTFFSTGAFNGHGTFTYARSATGAALKLQWLDEFAGDYDDFTLKFLEGAGLGEKANTFTGTMAAEGFVGEVSGTFSYE
jgi:hypothetical protein